MDSGTESSFYYGGSSSVSWLPKVQNIPMTSMFYVSSVGWGFYRFWLRVLKVQSKLPG